MSAARDPWNLGPATEALFAKAFAECALIPANKAGPLVGIDEKLLRGMAAQGVIRSVIVGASTRKFAEVDLRMYLVGERPPVEAAPARSKVTQKRKPDVNLVDIADLYAARKRRR